MPHVAHVNASTDESVMCRLDVSDSERFFGRAQRGSCETLPNVTEVPELAGQRSLRTRVPFP